MILLWKFGPEQSTRVPHAVLTVAVRQFWVVLEPQRFFVSSLRRRNKMRNRSRTGAGHPNQSRTRDALADRSGPARLADSMTAAAVVEETDSSR